MNDVPPIVSQLRSEEEKGHLHDQNIYNNLYGNNSKNKVLSKENDGYCNVNTIKQFFENLTDSFFLQDGNYHIKWINAKARQKYIMNQNIEMDSCFMLIFNKSAPCSFCPMKEAIETKKTHQIQTDIQGIGTCTITSIPLFSGQTLIGVLQQIKPENYQIHKKDKNDFDVIQTQQTIIENAALGIIVLDNHLHHITINPAFSGMTGFEQTELKKNRDIPIYWPDKFVDEIKTEIRRLQKKGQIKMETHFQRKDNSIFPVSVVGSTFIDKDTRENHMILIVDDITKNKTTERELKISQILLLSLIQNLEKKVKERTQQIELLLKQKNEFINQLGHDLKNPLGPLINLIPVLLKNETDPRKKHILDVILRNTTHMKNLITKTIELARLNSDNVRLNFEELDLTIICHESIIRNNHLFQENDMNIENNLSAELIVRADRLRMEELFDNIFTNAIKYSPKGGRIIINSSTTETTVTISIQDMGIGMSKDQLDHVFDEFFKADPSRHDFKSSGLGTSIIKRIVEKHGGHIKMESDGIGKGTTVTFTILKSPSSYNIHSEKRRLQNEISNRC